MVRKTTVFEKAFIFESRVYEYFKVSFNKILNYNNTTHDHVY